MDSVRSNDKNYEILSVLHVDTPDNAVSSSPLWTCKRFESQCETVTCLISLVRDMRDI